MLAVVSAALVVLPPSLTAQETESPLSPAGRLRIQVAPTFTAWDSRFGLRTEDGRTVEESERLGFDLPDGDATGLFPGVPDLEAAVADLLDDAEYDGILGNTRVRASADRITLPFRIDLGLLDRVTVGVTVPLVKSRTELAVHYDTTGANLGVSPALSDPALVGGYLDDLAAAEAAARQRATDLCGAQPGSTDCMSATELADDVLAFQNGLTDAYGAAFVFPTAASTAGIALRDRSDDLESRLTESGLDGLANNLPLASSLGGTEGLGRLFEETLGMAPLETRAELWELGDVELHALVRLLSGALRDSVGGPARARWEVGAGVLVRLGTGAMDDPAVLFDQAAGDGQTDVEGRAFANVKWGRVGLWTDARYGVQLSREIGRRVGPPDEPLVPRANLALLEWTPGNYLQIEIAPRIHLTDELALSGAYRLWSKAEDEYTRIGVPPEPPSEPWIPTGNRYTDASLLALESEETRQELGAGLSYNTLEAWREGRAPVPLEARFLVRWAVAGSGGMTPQTFTTGIALRIYHRLWGG